MALSAVAQKAIDEVKRMVESGQATRERAAEGLTVAESHLANGNILDPFRTPEQMREAIDGIRAYLESITPAEETSPTPEIVEKLIAAGGKEWRKDALHRIYFNDLARRVGLEYTTYKTGNVSSATLNGEKISNSGARGIINQLSFGKFWYDVPTAQFLARDIDVRNFETIKQSIEFEIGI